MVKPMGHDPATQAEQVALAADARPSSRDAIMSTPIMGEAGTITGVTTVSWKAGERHGVRAQAEGGVESERRDSREAQEGFDVMVGTERRDAREAQERFDDEVDAQRHKSRDAQAQVEAEIESMRRDNWKIQKQFDVRRDGERRETLERNEMLQSQLHQAQRLENLGQLAGGIAHDFNNLLAVILNYATFVSEEMDSATESDWSGRWETARGDITQIKQAAERAARLTHQLLAFARQSVVRPRVLDLDQVISGVTEMLHDLQHHASGHCRGSRSGPGAGALPAVAQGRNRLGGGG